MDEEIDDVRQLVFAAVIRLFGKKAEALARVARYRPKFTAVIVVLGGFTALLEGIGLSFIWLILEAAQAEEPITEAGGFLGMFLTAYETAGIPFILEFLTLGVAGVMTARFTASFLIGWFRSTLQKQHGRDLRMKTFNAALNAKVGYFDQEGSDDILNSIVTETRYSGRTIKFGVRSMKTAFLDLVYLSVMFYIAPTMAFFALSLLDVSHS